MQRFAENYWFGDPFMGLSRRLHEYRVRAAKVVTIFD